MPWLSETLSFDLQQAPSFIVSVQGAGAQVLAAAAAAAVGSVLPMMVTDKGPPCVYLDPWAFLPYFLPLLRKRSEKVAGWASGSWLRSTHHRFK